MNWPIRGRHVLVTVVCLCLYYWGRKASLHNNAARDPLKLSTAYEEFAVQPGLLFRDPKIRQSVLGSAFPKEFPKSIWQTSTSEGKSKWANASATWIDQNPDWEYHHLDDKAVNDFVHQSFGHRPAIIQVWDALTDVILRADFFRYLVLLGRGGVYTDIDTTSLTPVKDWVPAHLFASTNAVLGIEYDGPPLGWAIRNVSICQWTMMAKPGHPIFHTLVQRVMSNLDLLARIQRVELGQLKLDFSQVLAATGPGLVTDVVMEVMRDQLGSVQWETFQDIHVPTLFGDLLILPINGFGSAQKHSHSGEQEYGIAYARHHFGRSWYHKTGAGRIFRPFQEADRAQQSISDI